MHTADEEQPRILDPIHMLGHVPERKTPEETEELRALFRRVRDIPNPPIIVFAKAPEAMIDELPSLAQFLEMTAGTAIPKWHRDILLGMERNAPRMQVVDLMFNIPQAETSEAGKFLTITRSKSREGAAGHLAINPTRLRLGEFNKDLK